MCNFVTVTFCRIEIMHHGGHWYSDFSFPSVWYAGHTQKNGEVSEVIEDFISYPTRVQHTLSAAGTVQIFHAIPAVRFTCLLLGRGTSFQDGVTAGESFQYAAFWGVQICDYSAAWVSYTVITDPFSGSDITSKVPAWNQVKSRKIPYSPYAFTLVSSSVN
jgi:hypothetical protein